MVLYELWSFSQHKRLAIFTLLTIGWGIGWQLHLDLDYYSISAGGRAIYIWLRLLYGVSAYEHPYNWDDAEWAAEAWSTGGAIVGIIEFISAFPNAAATIFGAIGTVGAGLLGWFLKRPLQRQALATAVFKEQLSGYESLNRSLAARVAFLEAQISIKDEYESRLLQRLRECEEHLIHRPIGDRPFAC